MQEAQVARGLGWFSLGLGAAEIAAASQLSEFFNIGNKSTTFRALGVREIATGAAILRSGDPTRPVWARVIGDVIDAAVLGASARMPRSNRGRIGAAVAFVAVIGVVDFLCARALSK